jgi:hypothetical protein
MLAIDRTYIGVALLWAVAGMLLGLYMGIAADTTLRSMHVAMVLVAFVTPAIYGIIYRLWPKLKAAPLARVQFWITQLGAAGIVIGSYFYAINGSVPLVAGASIVFIVGAALMAWLFVSNGSEA